MYVGNAAPYQITQPSTDNVVQIVPADAKVASVTCSLNITIPSTVIVTWSHNNTNITDASQVTQTDNATRLVIPRNPQPSDAGVYQCMFNDTAGYVLGRSITLIVGKLFIYFTCINQSFYGMHIYVQQ